MNYKELPEITEKQQEILGLVYRFRFINRRQIQKILHHKDPKRINAWLRDLVGKGYLGRIYSHKLLLNTKPAVYYLNNTGVLWVRFTKGSSEGDALEFTQVKKFYEDKHASETFINHCLFICDLYVQIKAMELGRKNLEYDFETKTELWTEEQIEGDIEDMREYLPDVYIERVVETKKRLDIAPFFLELFDPHVPRFAMRYKVKKYLEFSESGEWRHTFESLQNNFPPVLFILSNQQKLNSLSRYIKKQLDEKYDSEPMTFRLTTYEKIQTEGLKNNSIWNTVTEE